MSSLAIFEFDSHQIRFVNGMPVANDVAKVLGYSDLANTIRKRVDPEYKGIEKVATPGGVQKVTVLKEPGIYQLIFGSKLSTAKAFQAWVFEEVLPSIRETGSYSIKNKKANKEWLKERQECKEVRRELMDSIKDYIDRHPELSSNAKKFLYSNTTEAMMLGLFGRKTKRLKQDMNLDPKLNVRDFLDKKELITFKCIEYLACQLIDIEDTYPHNAIKKAIEISLSSNKYLDYCSTSLPLLSN